MPSEIVIVVARARDGTIGKDGTLPWHIPADLKRFKALTMGSAMVMGRKTFESLPGILPGRRHIVLTRDRGWSAEGADVAHDADAAIKLVDDDTRLSVIGGAEIFALFEPLATRIELTDVLADYDGETVIPDPRDGIAWQEVEREEHPAAGGAPAYRFITLARAS